MRPLIAICAAALLCSAADLRAQTGDFNSAPWSASVADTDALRQSIWFGPDVPIEVRQAIVDGVRTLVEWPETMEESEENTILGQPPDYVADWLLALNLVVVGSCPEWALLPPGKDLVLKEFGEKSRGQCLEAAAKESFDLVGGMFFRLDPAPEGSLAFVRVGVRAVQVRHLAATNVVYVESDGDLSTVENPWQLPTMAMLHEAAHVFFTNVGHVECEDPGSLFDGLHPEIAREYTSLTGKACDSHPNGAFTMATDFLSMVADRSADPCHLYETAGIGGLRLNLSDSIRTKMSEMTGLDLPSQVPNEQFFDALEDKISYCADLENPERLRQDVLRLRALLKFVWKQAEYPSLEIAENIKVPENAAEAWLAALDSGKYPDLNVPNHRTVSCAVFEGGC